MKTLNIVTVKNNFGLEYKNSQIIFIFVDYAIKNKVVERP